MEAAAVPGYRLSPSKAVRVSHWCAHRMHTWVATETREVEKLNAGSAHMNVNSTGSASLFLLFGCSGLTFASRTLNTLTPLIHKHTHIHRSLNSMGPKCLISIPTPKGLYTVPGLDLGFFQMLVFLHSLTVPFKYSIICLLFPMRLINIDNLVSLVLISYKVLCEPSQGCAYVVPLVIIYLWLRSSGLCYHLPYCSLGLVFQCSVYYFFSSLSLSHC